MENEKPKAKPRGRGRPFVKGNIANPNGRPKGALSFHTHFKIAVQRIKDSKTGEPIDEIDIVYKYLEKALSKDDKGLLDKLVDRLYGKSLERLDHTTDGKPIPTPIYGGRSKKV